MRSALYLINMLSWIFILLVHRNNCPRVNMSLHSDTLSWFRANHPSLYLLNAAWMTEKQQIPILQSLVWPDQVSNPRSTALKASTLTITPPMNPRSTALKASTLTITPPRNPRSTALYASTLAITPPMNPRYTALEASMLTIYIYISSNPRSSALEASTLTIYIYIYTYIYTSKMVCKTTPSTQNKVIKN
jgi:hypothetical protein